MTIALSLQALQLVVAENSDDGFLGLVTITIPNSPVIRLVYNNVAVTSNGNVFSPAFLDITLSSALPGEPARAEVSMAGLSQVNLASLIAADGGEVIVDIEYVLISDVNTVQRQNKGLVLTNFTLTDGDLFKGTLRGRVQDRAAYPGVRMTIATVPGIFGSVP